MTYSISDLERLSGVHSHTIRIWEQRYSALKPMRSEGNTRYYDDQQLKKLLNIVSLNQAGYKISKICGFSDQKVNDLLDEQFPPKLIDSSTEFYISKLLKHGLEFNEFNFSKEMDNCISDLGILEAYRKVIYPLLVRLGLMWRKDNICPAQEHFISNLIRQKLFVVINDTSGSNPKSKTWLLFLPEDEDHDIGLLLAYYMLKHYQQVVIYLGSKVPLSSLKAVFSTTNVDHVLFFMTTTRMEDAAQNYINQLSETCKEVQIHLAGNNSVIEKLKNIDHISWFKTLDEFEQSIQKSL